MHAALMLLMRCRVERHLVCLFGVEYPCVCVAWCRLFCLRCSLAGLVGMRFCCACGIRDRAVGRTDRETDRETPRERQRREKPEPEVGPRPGPNGTKCTVDMPRPHVLLLPVYFFFSLRSYVACTLRFATIRHVDLHTYVGNHRHGYVSARRLQRGDAQREKGYQRIIA